MIEYNNDYVSKLKFIVSVVLVQYAAPLVCMEAQKRARLSQKELEGIPGQLINVDMDIRPGKVDSLFLISLPLVVKVASSTFIIALKH